MFNMATSIKPKFFDVILVSSINLLKPSMFNWIKLRNIILEVIFYNERPDLSTKYTLLILLYFRTISCHSSYVSVHNYLIKTTRSARSVQPTIQSKNLHCPMDRVWPDSHLKSNHEWISSASYAHQKRKIGQSVSFKIRSLEQFSLFYLQINYHILHSTSPYSLIISRFFVNTLFHVSLIVQFNLNSLS